MLGVCREEFGKQWGNTKGEVARNALGCTLMGGFFGGLIAVIPAFVTGIYIDTEASTKDVASVYGLSQASGHRMIDFNGEDIALFRENGEFQVYMAAPDDSGDLGQIMRYVAGMPDALEAIDNTLSLIDTVQARLVNGQSLSGLDLPGIQSIVNPTIAYDNGGDSIVRYFDSAVTDTRVNTDYAALLTEVRGELTQARNAMLDGGYGVDQLRHGGVAPKESGGKLALMIAAAFMVMGIVTSVNLPTITAVRNTRGRIRRNKGLDKKNG